MSYVIAAPEALVAAATDLATLGSTIGAANAAAAGSTTALLTAGADEVSAAIAAYSECTARPIRHSVRGRRRSMSGSCRPWPQVGRLCGRRGRQRLAAAERARFAECAHSGAVGASVGGQWRQWGPGGTEQQPAGAGGNGGLSLGLGVAGGAGGAGGSGGSDTAGHGGTGGAGGLLFGAGEDGTTPGGNGGAGGVAGLFGDGGNGGNAGVGTPAGNVGGGGTGGLLLGQDGMTGLT